MIPIGLRDNFDEIKKVVLLNQPTGRKAERRGATQYSTHRLADNLTNFLLQHPSRPILPFRSLHTAILEKM